MINETKPSAAEAVITLTPAAVTEVKRLIAEEKETNLFLRLGVTSGGCSGMSYSMAFDNQPGDFDREFDFEGLKVRVDLKALMYLAGTTLDFKGGLVGGGFQFHNPKAKRSCGCGSSFTC
ncbi:MAG: iron-sulfur cluster assembly accessory protein [Candidatus Zixiibacteriota bacterium]